jgi:hypothetical protein
MATIKFNNKNNKKGSVVTLNKPSALSNGSLKVTMSSEIEKIKVTPDTLILTEDTHELFAGNGSKDLVKIGNIVTGKYMSDFPATGDTSKIYIAEDEHSIYLWDGTAYTVITTSSSMPAIDTSKFATTTYVDAKIAAAKTGVTIKDVNDAIAASGHLTAADIANKVNTGDVYSKYDIDKKLTAIAASVGSSKGDLTKAQADTYYAALNHNHDARYALKSDLSAKADASNVYTKSDIDSKGFLDEATADAKYAPIGSTSSGSTTSGISEADVDAKLANYVKTTDLPTDHATTADLALKADKDSVYNKTEADNTFLKKSDGLTATDVNNAITSGMTNYYTKSEADALFAIKGADGGTATGLDATQVQAKIDSSLAGYAKLTDIPSDHVTSSDAQTIVNNTLASKNFATETYVQAELAKVPTADITKAQAEAAFAPINHNHDTDYVKTADLDVATINTDIAQAKSDASNALSIANSKGDLNKVDADTYYASINHHHGTVYASINHTHDSLYVKISDLNSLIAAYLNAHGYTSESGTGSGSNPDSGTGTPSVPSGGYIAMSKKSTISNLNSIVGEDVLADDIIGGKWEFWFMGLSTDGVKENGTFSAKLPEGIKMAVDGTETYAEDLAAFNTAVNPISPNHPVEVRIEDDNEISLGTDAAADVYFMIKLVKVS